MPRVRVTYFFEQGDAGWSESIHTSFSSDSAVSAAVTRYTAVRVQLLSTAARITHIRVSDDEVFRDIALFPTGLPVVGVVSGPTAPPFVALLARLKTGSLVQRSLFLRGIPAVFTQTGAFVPGGLYASALNAYRNELLTGGWVIAFKDRTQAKVPIISVNPTTGAVITRDPVTGLTLQDNLQLLGVPRSLVARRFFTLSSITTNSSFSVRNWPGGFTLVNQGFFRRKLTVSSQITDVSFDRVTERRTGRPFGLLRGRAAPVR